ncbi:cupin domain-containing protein [Pelagibius sp. Alg239-R121]|uniref:cupin domain-containing protein n=1 Tax=Pelagibius sp. Alg239-R121 TaxID=2993448 RepID=UPI0024A659B5|nr:cupin domain-containing protein [Pelagibius sp. Alg239-R121]
MSKRDIPAYNELDRLASEFVLGTLHSDDRAGFLIKLDEDPQLRELVAQWEDRLALLEDRLAATVDGSRDSEPAHSLWGRIESQIDALGPRKASTVRAESGNWREIGPGVEWKLLHLDKESGEKSLLLKLAPGAIYPAHEHSSVEECMIIEGDMIIGDLQLYSGDYHVVQPGTRHEDVTSQNGGLVFIRHAA